MKHTLVGMALVLLAVLPLPVASCSVRPGNAGPTPERAVTITYKAAFAGETPSGDLNLVVDMTIANKGYESFDIAPSRFAAEVADYSYKPVSSELPAARLEEGKSISGRLTFHIPPQAATSRVGYRLTYAGETKYAVEWVKAEAAADNVAVEPSKPVVNISYSTELLWVSPPGIDYLKVEPPGKMYLMVEMFISNRGYESFRTTPSFFSLKVSSLGGSFTSQVEGQLIDWRDINLQNSGDFTGTLAFPVKQEVAQSFYQWDYKLAYSGTRDYNIQWSKLRVSSHPCDLANTKLQAVNLKDGQIISGKIAYAVSTEIAASKARYKMLYDERTDHNVQWANQTGLEVDVDRNPIKYPAIKITYSTSLVQREGVGRWYVIVDVTIANRGYESFDTSPGHFYLEASY